MRKYLFILCWFIGQCGFATGYDDSSGSGLTFRYGPWGFAAPGDSSWSTQWPTKMGAYDIYTWVDVKGQSDSFSHQHLYLSLLASATVYWDGVLLGHNGRVGTDKASEVPGAVRAVFLLPDSLLRPGRHQLRIETSNFHAAGKIRYYGLWVDDYLAPIVSDLKQTIFLHVYAGFFLIISLYFGLRFLGNTGQWHLLAFAVLCGSFFVLLLLEFIKSYYFYPYPWHFTRLRIIMGVSQLIGFCLTLFCVLKFRIEKSWLIFVLQLLSYVWLLSVTDRGFDYPTNYSVMLAFLFASIIATYAWWRKQSGSIWVLLGILPVFLALVIWFRWYDLVLYLGFGHLVLMVLIATTREEKKMRDEKAAALQLSHRLELELLKKNIQPHFIMNSITSSIDWLENEPTKGVQLLLALSREFEILLDISDKKQIPITREIELCRAHLEIMGFRKLTSYTFTATEINETLAVPPAILLTLVENGLTHQGSDLQPPAFHLTYSFRASEHQLRFLSTGSPKTKANPKVAGGTGLKYVKARLAESYGTGWTFTHGPTDTGWETIIIFR
ncbi:MAG: histidine kinase [Bacteroidota bacterium]